MTKEDPHAIAAHCHPRSCGIRELQATRRTYVMKESLQRTMYNHGMHYLVPLCSVSKVKFIV